MEEIFHKYLPDTLYMSHYELAKMYGHTPQEWRKFLRDNSIFIESELAAIAEAEARSALSRLSNASGTEVAALKTLLEKSKLINDAQKQNVKVVLSYVPDAWNDKQKQEELKPYKPTVIPEVTVPSFNNITKQEPIIPLVTEPDPEPTVDSFMEEVNKFAERGGKVTFKAPKQKPIEKPKPKPKKPEDDFDPTDFF